VKLRRFTTIFEQNGLEFSVRVLGGERGEFFLLDVGDGESAGQATPPCWTDLSKTTTLLAEDYF
jgi:hypothetical protein